MKNMQLSYRCPKHSRPVKGICRSKNWVFVDMCEAELFPNKSPNMAPERQWNSLFEEREFRGESLDNPSLPRLCIVNASQTVPECPAFVSWFIVPIIEHEKRVHTRPLCATQVGEKVRLRQRFIPFLSVFVRQVCTQTHKVIQGNQGLQNTKSFLQIMAKSLYKMLFRPFMHGMLSVVFFRFLVWTVLG